MAVEEHKPAKKRWSLLKVLKGLKPGDRVITSSYDGFANKEKLLLKEK
jgi:hypothetical protein